VGKALIARRAAVVAPTRHIACMSGPIGGLKRMARRGFVVGWTIDVVQPLLTCHTYPVPVVGTAHKADQEQEHQQCFHNTTSCMLFKYSL